MSKIRQINLEKAIERSIRGIYNYIVIEGSGSRDFDIPRQISGLTLYHLSLMENSNARIFLDGYGDCSEQTTEDFFNKDERLVNRKVFFPWNRKLEIAFAHNTPATARELVNRKNKEYNKIVYITSKNAQRRSARVIYQYFAKDAPEQIDVLGVPCPSDTKKNKFYENLGLILSDLFFIGTQKGSDPKKLTRIYDGRRYNKIGKNIKKLLSRRIDIKIE